MAKTDIGTNESFGFHDSDTHSVAIIANNPSKKRFGRNRELWFGKDFVFCFARTREQSLLHKN
jgi:hypothetical protein